MTFPVFIEIGSWKIHPHLLFEALGYVVGVTLLLLLRHRRGDPIAPAQRWLVGSAAGIGGTLGSRLLAYFQESGASLVHGRIPLTWPMGKTIVGGLIGGLIAVEWSKRRMAITTATGDLFALPLAVGIAIGRIGCFLAGLADHTYGTQTALWMGVDFGDGIPRHPTQLYEIIFLLILAFVLSITRERIAKAGDVFRLFMVAYLTFRLLIESIKPEPTFVFGLSAIQWACAGALLYYSPHIRRWLRRVPSSRSSTSWQGGERLAREEGPVA